jgi:hypothetical protein
MQLASKWSMIGTGSTISILNMLMSDYGQKLVKEDGSLVKKINNCRASKLLIPFFNKWRSFTILLQARSSTGNGAVLFYILLHIIENTNHLPFRIHTIW